MKWPFRRNEQVEQSEVEVPTEIQEYYQAERRERTGMAWLLGLATLAITVLLAVGLFFGGRWVYRKVVDKPSNDTTNTSNVTQAPAEASRADNAAPGEPAPATDNSQQATATTPSPTPTGPPSATSSLNTSQTAGAQTNALPSTGPANLLATFVTATVLGTITHRIYSNRRLSGK